MNNNQIIPLFKLLDNQNEMLELYKEYNRFFDTYEEFFEFCKMQSKYYPNGIIRMTFLENATNYSANASFLSLRQKMGNDLIQEHTTDDGVTYYSLGNPES